MGRPGKSEPDFIFFPHENKTVRDFYGVIELKTPQSKILRAPRKDVLALSSNAATAVAQARYYLNHFPDGIITRPHDAVFIGNRAYAFVIIGLSHELKSTFVTEIAKAQLSELLPPNFQILPFDTVYKLFSETVPPTIMELVIADVENPALPVAAQSNFTPQKTFIHPSIDGKNIGYFEWLGAATYVMNRSLRERDIPARLDTGYAGINDEYLCCRLDFPDDPSDWSREEATMALEVESRWSDQRRLRSTYRLEMLIHKGQILRWTFADAKGSRQPEEKITVALNSIFECQIPHELLDVSRDTVLWVRFSLRCTGSQSEYLPPEGSIELRVVDETELASVPYTEP
jgi:hypothetical protein